MEVKRSRQPMTGAAEFDPQRHFATVNYRIAKGSFASVLGAPRKLHLLTER